MFIMFGAKWHEFDLSYCVIQEKLTALEQSMLCHYEEPSSEGQISL